MNISTLKPRVDALRRELLQKHAQLSLDDRKLYSKKEFWNTLFEALYPVKTALGSMFGSQNRWEKEASSPLGHLFSYRPTVHHSEGLLIAYYEPVESTGNLEAATKEIDKRFRSEVFMKGSRWSKPRLKDAFYVYLQRIARFLDTENYPLDFWKSNPEKNYLTIIPGFTAKALSSANDGPLLMPFVHLPRGTWPTKLKHCNALWRKVTSGKKDLNIDFSQDEFGRAEQEFNRHSGHLLDPFRTYLLLLGWKANQLTPEAIFRLITLYHCYDAPYTIHLFRSNDGRTSLPKGSPTSARMDKDPKAIIAVTLPTSAPALKADQQEFFQGLCDTIGLLHDIESWLARKRRRHIELFWRLERAYSDELPKYRRLVHTVGLMLDAACEQAGIPTQHPTAVRTKEAESLFTKLCDWSNGRKKRSKQTPKAWRQAVETTNLSFITKYMPDVGGARIVCVFEKDLDRALEAIDGLVDGGDLICRKPWARKQLFEDREDGLLIKGYRAWHCDVSLGKTRLNLIECSGLQELACEIQLKSAVAHAWSDASHKISYKTGVPSKVFRESRKGTIVRQGIGKAAVFLTQGDTDMNRAKTAYDGLTGG